jgi:hypothetical protein
MMWGKAKQVSEKFAIPLSSVYYYAKTGALPCKIIAGRKFYPLDMIDKEFNKGVKDSVNARVW